MTQPEWDDERLAAAFHARFDRPAPHPVTAAVHDAIAGTTPARPSPFSRLSAARAAAAAVVVVVVAGAAAIGMGGFGLSGDVQPSAGPPGPTAAATPSDDVDTRPAIPPAIPASVLGLDVVTVTGALAVRDMGFDDRELAVVGWFTPAPPTPCPRAPEEAVSPVQPRCPDQFVWLTEAPESLVEVTAGSLSSRPPVSPALNPDLLGLDRSWQPRLVEIGAEGDSVPAHVVLVGHFDDRRSRLCPDAEEPACRDRFVVDQVAWVDGEAPPLSRVSLLEGVAARSSLGEVQAIVAEEAPDSPVLSVVTVDGALGLRSVEPSLGTGRRGLIDQPVLWVVRVLESGRLVTYVVVDGSDAIYEMTDDGDAVPVGGSLGPPASAGAWPPAGSVVIELTSRVVGYPPAQVAVVDLSGRLTGVAKQGFLDLDVAIGGNSVRAYPEAGLPGRVTPGRVHLYWDGGLCDSEIVVTVGADLRSIVVDRGPQQGCRLMLVTRALVLDFSGSVDVPAIDLYRASARTAADRQASAAS